MSDELETQAHDASVAEMTEPIANPGLPEHLPRPQDVDEAQARRTERQISAMFLTAGVLFLLFGVAYFSIGSEQTFMTFSAMNVALGGTLGGGLLLIGVGVIQWAKKLMADHELVEMRHPARSSDEDREEIMGILQAGSEESGIARRPLLRNSLFGAVGLLVVPGVVSLRDLGTLPYGEDETVWRRGMRVVNDVSGLPIKPGDLEVGQLVNAEPSVFFPQEGEEEAEYHGIELLQAKSKAAVILVRMRPEDIRPSAGRENWGIDGILCYSKICTHVGCPISLWEQQTHQLLCPCHQSTFDLADNGKVVFGPAHRPLPQLPLGLDSEGYIIAMSDFPEIVAPSYPGLAQDQKKLDERMNG